MVSYFAFKFIVEFHTYPHAYYTFVTCTATPRHHPVQPVGVRGDVRPREREDAGAGDAPPRAAGEGVGAVLHHELRAARGYGGGAAQEVLPPFRHQRHCLRT